MAEELHSESRAGDEAGRQYEREEKLRMFRELVDNITEYMHSRPPIKTVETSYREFLINLSQEVADPVVMLRQRGTQAPLFTEGNLSLVVGAAKSRKTTLMVALCATLLGGPQLGMEAVRQDYKVVYMDTEQGRNYAHMTARKIHRLMGWPLTENNPRLLYFDLREATVERRLQVLEEVLLCEQPNFLFLDGLVDICGDFNDNRHCGKLVNHLMKLASENNCHICAALHFNKDKATERGHLGAMYKQKCETTIDVVKLQGYSEARPSADGCRGVEFTAFTFATEGNHGLPVEFTPEGKPDAKKLSAEERQKAVLRQILTQATNPSLKLAPLKDEFMELYRDDSGKKVCSEYAERIIYKKKKEGFLSQLADKSYTLAEYVPATTQTEINTEEEDECPF